MRDLSNFGQKNSMRKFYLTILLSLLCACGSNSSMRGTSANPLDPGPSPSTQGVTTGFTQLSVSGKSFQTASYQMVVTIGNPLAASNHLLPDSESNTNLDMNLFPVNDEF